VRSLKALNERLQTLGLQNPSYEDISRTRAGGPLSPKSPASDRKTKLGSGFRTPDRTQRSQGPPSLSEVRPQDSISMYSPFRRPGPASSVPSSRRGGTNVDTGEGTNQAYPPEERFEDDWESHAGVTMGSPRSGVESQEHMTLAPTSAWTTGTL